MGHLIWEQSLGVFLLVTVMLGGGTAYMTGRAVALGWNGRWLLVAYVLLLACAVRFIHYALFGGTLLAPHYFVVDFVVLLAVASLAFVHTRARQMASQYSFGFEGSGPFGWRPRAEP